MPGWSYEDKDDCDVKVINPLDKCSSGEMLHHRDAVTFTEGVILALVLDFLHKIEAYEGALNSDWTATGSPFPIARQKRWSFAVLFVGLPRSTLS